MALLTPEYLITNTEKSCRLPAEYVAGALNEGASSPFAAISQRRLIRARTRIGSLRDDDSMTE
jgi:hypothetical protein